MKVYGCILCLIITMRGMVNSSAKKITKTLKSVDVGGHFTGKATFPTSRASHDVAWPVSLTKTAGAGAVCYYP